MKTNEISPSDPRIAHVTDRIGRGYRSEPVVVFTHEVEYESYEVLAERRQLEGTKR